MGCGCGGTPIEKKIEALKEKLLPKIEVNMSVLQDKKLAVVLGTYDRIIDLLVHTEIISFYKNVDSIVVNAGPTDLPVKSIKIPSPGFVLGPILSLLEGLREAHKLGYDYICYRNGDDWIFNRDLVEYNFGLMAQEGVEFQAYNWFNNNNMDEFALNEVYLDVKKFYPHLEEGRNLFLRHSGNCENRFAWWVRHVNPKFRRLTGREQGGGIGYSMTNHGDNNRWFNRSWQLISEHDGRRRHQDYYGIRNDIPYAQELEQKPFMKQWLNSIRFVHGIGDIALWTHTLPLYNDKIYIECERDKIPLFEAAGAIFTNGAAKNHPYYYPKGIGIEQWDTPSAFPNIKHISELPQYNKVSGSISREPMPNIGTPLENWKKLCAVKLSCNNHFTDAIRNKINSYTKDLPRPWILVHMKSSSGPQWKNLEPHQEYLLLHYLLDKTNGTIINLDWENHQTKVNNYRHRHLIDDMEKFSVLETIYLMTQSDLFIGCDSSCAHLTRFTEIPAIVWWAKHHPAWFTLPREKTLNLVTTRFSELDKVTRIEFNTICQEAEITAESISNYAVQMLQFSKYLPQCRIAADIQLQYFMGKTRSHDAPLTSYVDRNKSFNIVIDYLSKLKNPIIVETGCIRGEEDWGSPDNSKCAGFSTYLFGCFLHGLGRGKLHSIELNQQNVDFAKKWTEVFGNSVEVHNAHSHQWLQDNNIGIDVFYSDSQDVGEPGFEENCLREVQLALPKINPGGLILIDDTVYNNKNWHGKGTTAVPWLLNNGWTIIHAGYQTLLRRTAEIGIQQDISLLPVDKLKSLVKLLEKTSHLNGDVAEFGVYHGGSAKVIAQHTNKKIHLFDTFTSMPDDDIFAEGHKKLDFCTNLDRVKNYLSDYRKNTIFHVGHFPETTKNLPSSMIYSLVHVDADTYQSTKNAIEYFYPRLVPGGIIVFDDYKWPQCPGVEQAILERFKESEVSSNCQHQCYIEKV
jgi:predicted O-methyltransferase YrrM